MTKLLQPPPTASLPGVGEPSQTLSEQRAVSGIRKLSVRTSLGRPRVLLIGPNPARGVQYERALESDCEVELVESASQAFQVLVCDRDFRMILCPGKMPDSSGSEFLTQIRQLNLAGCPRVVIFDGSEDAREIIDAIQLGVRQYLPGPCPPAELAKKVTRLLGLT